MAEVKIEIPALNKEVLVNVPDGSEADQETLSEVFAYVSSLVAHNQIKDAEAGLMPSSATHEIVKGDDDQYRLQRLGFN